MNQRRDNRYHYWFLRFILSENAPKLESGQVCIADLCEEDTQHLHYVLLCGITYALHAVKQGCKAFQLMFYHLLLFTMCHSVQETMHNKDN